MVNTYQIIQDSFVFVNSKNQSKDRAFKKILTNSPGMQFLAKFEASGVPKTFVKRDKPKKVKIKSMFL